MIRPNLTRILPSIIAILVVVIIILMVIRHYYHPLPASIKMPVISTTPRRLITPDTVVLLDNPLHPYKVYDNLLPRLYSLPAAEVDRFLATFGQTPLADKLRKQWLKVLADKQQWLLFLHYYQPYKNADMRCLYATALLRTDQKQQAYELADDLWMVPYSQSPSCDGLFSDWLADHQLTTVMVWQRFNLALKANQPALATYLMTLLPIDEQSTAQLWLKLRAQPELITDKTLFPADNDNLNDLLIYGIEQLAAKNPSDAADAWNKLKTMHHFYYAPTQRALQAIAVGFIKQDHTKADAWLKQINPEYINELAMNWRLRLALEDKNWGLLADWINKLPMTMRDDPEWQYWYARAIEQQGDKSEAQKRYTELAMQQNYYGFLAASRLKQPFTIHNQSQPISNEQSNAFYTNPAIQRMMALYAINQQELGNGEWWYALEAMNEKQRYVALKIAEKWHLNGLALSSLSYLTDQQDLSIRFPLLYSPIIKQRAALLKLDPAFIYAIIRQESLFRANASSRVGAQGLMQLMPGTAEMLVRQYKLPYAMANQLADPATNIQLGSLYLSKLLARNNQNPALVAASYNAGPARVQQWLNKTDVLEMDMFIDTIPYPETRNYVKRVMTFMVIYQSLLGMQPSLNAVLQPIKE